MGLKGWVPRRLGARMRSSQLVAWWKGDHEMRGKRGHGSCGMSAARMRGMKMNQGQEDEVINMSTTGPEIQGGNDSPQNGCCEELIDADEKDGLGEEEDDGEDGDDGWMER